MRPFHIDPTPGYPPAVGRFVSMLVDTRRRLHRDLDDLEAGELDRTPPWAPNSIGTLLYHIAAIELDWTCADLRQTEIFPDGTEDWFPVDVREDDGRLTPVVDSLERHWDRLEWVRSHLLATLAEMDDADLDRTFAADGQGNGGAFILHHLMQHEAEHRGQIGEIRAASRE